MKKLFNVIDAIVDLFTGFSMMPFRSVPVHHMGCIS